LAADVPGLILLGGTAAQLLQDQIHVVNQRGTSDAAPNQRFDGLLARLKAINGPAITLAQTPV